MRRLLPLLLLAPLAACGASDGEGADQTLTVYAAASLTGAFEQLGEEFESAHEGVTVELTFGGSSDLVTQVQEGAPADVFASADEDNMAKLVDAGLASGPEEFATNTLQIAVPPGNPAGVRSFADLARPGLNLVVCAPEVPCGAATQRAADVAGVSLSPVSEEQSVTDVLGKVLSGEADAGVVYVTDVRAAGDAVEAIDFPEAAGAVNTYPITVVEGADDAALAREFVDLVRGPTGQRVLGEAGFGAP